MEVPSPSPSPSPSPLENRPQISATNIQTTLEHSEFHKQTSLSDVYQQSPTSILDKPLGLIIDETFNFTVRSIDEYYSRYSEAEEMMKNYQENKGILDGLKVHMYAIVLFFKHGENIIYIGILMIVVSLIIYFINISTS